MKHQALAEADRARALRRGFTKAEPPTAMSSFVTVSYFLTDTAQSFVIEFGLQA